MDAVQKANLILEIINLALPSATQLILSIKLSSTEKEVNLLDIDEIVAENLKRELAVLSKE